MTGANKACCGSCCGCFLLLGVTTLTGFSISFEPFLTTLSELLKFSLIFNSICFPENIFPNPIPITFFFFLSKEKKNTLN